MTCSFCGTNNCYGTCMTAQRSQQGIQGSCIINNPNYVQGYLPAAGAVQGQNGFVLQGVGSWPTPVLDTSLYNFLEIIADRSDTDACVAFIEQQLAIRANQVKELEKLQKQYQADLEKNEREFLEKCQKYRPTISSEIINRVKGLKAFY
jgi:hypothetical protein